MPKPQPLNAVPVPSLEKWEGCVRKSNRRKTCAKLLCGPVGRGEMTEVQPVLDFASSGRSGRRNALPDILGSPAGVNPSDLPLKLTELSLTEQSEAAGMETVAEDRETSTQ
ncbi:hypothetical protein QTP70_005052 [Hemibagrus guttatus]|uniref:cAMP-dependent protein kinase inhibitor beta n=1 Tax=Hemibagrus guttatus TaxID=175788 RepID=A0AAE0PU26_9TELE|nr:hypothetical protein QTP70_005052 [Hemibagrus guttatus]